MSLIGVGHHQPAHLVFEAPSRKGYADTTTKFDQPRPSNRRAGATSRKITNNERGVSLLEFSLIAPILILLLMAVVDLGRSLNHYLGLTRICSDVAKYAAQTRALESGSFSTADANPWPTVHNVVRLRVRALLRSKTINPDEPTVMILSKLTIQPDPSRPLASPMRVDIEIEIPFTPIFPPFMGLTSLRGKSSAEYAYP